MYKTNTCSILKDLTWYNRLHFIAMLLMAISIPVGYHCGLWACIVLGAASVVKMIAQRRIGNRSLSKTSVAALGAIILYWLIYLVSLARGGDVHEGVQTIVRKAVLLIFASIYLLTDTFYLKEEQLRWLFYGLWASICGVFFYYIWVNVSRLFNGCSPEEAFGELFDPRHHAYIALYVDTALAFVYFELQSQWGNLKHWLRTALILSVPLLVLYVLMINSRAGVLCMWVVAAVCILHLSFFKQRWSLGLMVALLFVGYTLAISYVLPGHTDRIADTVERVTESTKDESKSNDDRIYINKSALNLALDRWVLGYGVGNYHVRLFDRYKQDVFNKGYTYEFNAHNQYMETLLAVGIIGLIPMLAFLLIPLYQAWRKRKYVLPVLLFTAIVCFNLLFESMLERQMGLLFIGYFMSVMILLVNLREGEESGSF